MTHTVAFDGVWWLIDPDCTRNPWWSRRSVDEAFRMVCKGVVEHLLSCGLNLVGQAVVHFVRCEQPQSTVTVLGVVPGEKCLEIGARVVRTGEATRVRRCVFECLELAFRVRIVIGHARPRVAGQDVQIDQPACSRPATVKTS